MKKTGKKWRLFSTIAALLLTIGISYAWFMQKASMKTLMEILPPDEITIIPISEKDGSEMTALDLDFHENSNDYKDEYGIHILRPVCIKSTSPVHRLEIVHTTNLKSLKFNIFPATKDGQKFTYDKDKWINGDYMNPGTTPGLAKADTLENYTSTEEVADAHAYPLYWIAVNCAINEKWQEGWQKVTSYSQDELDPATQTEKKFYYTYYYLEISWKEETKETDLFYIMAQNIAQ